MSLPEPATGVSPVTLLASLDSEAGRLSELVARLQRELDDAADAGEEADVIRRHVLRHPERFAPDERERASDRAQDLAGNRRTLEERLQAAHERAALCAEMGTMLRGALEQISEGAEQVVHTTSALQLYQAVEAERLRIARDLHDGPAQVLADLVLRAEILDKIAESNPDGLRQELAEFKNSVRNVVADMRKFMFDLRPDSLDDLGLVATMRRYTNSFGDRTGVTCRFNMTGEDRRLPPSLEETLFRIMQEALTNVQRHAAAKTVEVTLNVTGEHATARVRDDGSGFDPAHYQEPVGRRKLGVLGMTERAAALGGRLEVSSQPGRGTEIRAEFELPR